MIVFGIICLLIWAFLMGWVVSYLVGRTHSAIDLSWELRDDYPDVPWVDGSESLVYPEEQ